MPGGGRPSINQSGGQPYMITGKITGTLFDSITKKPIEFASVSLTKKNWRQIFGGTITDSKGNFKIDKVAPGTYQVNISFIGYNNKLIDDIKTTFEKLDANVGKIYLAPSSIDLQEVVVQEKTKLIENRVDKLVYNAEKDITSKGGNASDVLRKVPMVTVDIEGNPQLKGSRNIKVLINGKPSGMLANNLSEALKAIPSDQIKSIEVITSPSAKYDAEGTAGIINIITKKNNLEGMNGNINAGAGTRSNNLNGALNVKRGRTAITSDVYGSYNIPREGYMTLQRKNFIDPADTFTLIQDGDFLGKQGGFGASVGLDYDFNAYNNISSNLDVNNFFFSRKNDLNISSVFKNSDTVLNFPSSTTSSKSITDNLAFDWNLDYIKKFERKKDEELSFSFQYSQDRQTENYKQNDNQKSKNTGMNREGTFQSDYVLPIKKKMTLETGVKGIQRAISGEYNLETKDTAGNFQKSPVPNNEFIYGQGIYAGYAITKFKFNDKYELKGGLRYEYTTNDISSGGRDTAINYDNLFPSFIAARTFDNYSQLKLSYSKRLQRPGLYNLNPFVNSSNPSYIEKGNPKLRPEITHAIEVSYGKFGERKSYQITGYYSYTQDVIQNITESPDPNGVTINTYDNTGYSENTGMNFYGQWEKTNNWTLSGSGNIYYLKQIGVIDSVKILSDDIPDNVQYNIYVNSTWEFKKVYSVEVFGVFNSRRITLQGKEPGFTFMAMGIKKQIWKKKGSIGLQIFNPISPNLIFKSETTGKNFYQSSEFGIPFRSLQLTFTYKFGKMEFKEKKKGVKNEDMKQQNQQQF